MICKCYLASLNSILENSDGKSPEKMSITIYHYWLCLGWTFSIQYQLGFSIDSFLLTNCRQYDCRLFVAIFLIF